MNLNYVWTVFLAAIVLNGYADEIDFKGMESAEETFQERQKTELVSRMSLKTMFPDPEVRALAKAAGKGRLKEIDKLVEQGVDVNSLGKKGVPPLYWAFRNLDGFTRLLELGADPNIIFEEGSVMHWAAMHKDTRFLKAALKHGGDPNLAAPPYGETPLFDSFLAGTRNKTDALPILLDAGADVNATKGGMRAGRHFKGVTAFMVAADVLRYDVVYMMLLRGADYHMKDSNDIGLMDRITLDNGHFVPGSEQEASLNKVIDWLAERGVSLD